MKNRSRHDYPGLMRYMHAFGAAACAGLAFYGPLGVLEERQPLAYAHGGIAERINMAREVPCASCNRIVTSVDLRPEAASLPYVYVAPERRGRPRGSGLKPIKQSSGPVSLGQIEAASGVARRKLREMCAAGDVPGAYRHHGRRGDWRVPMREARSLIARLMGDGQSSAA